MIASTPWVEYRRSRSPSTPSGPNGLDSSHQTGRYCTVTRGRGEPDAAAMVAATRRAPVQVRVSTARPSICRNTSWECSDLSCRAHHTGDHLYTESMRSRSDASAVS